MVVLTSLKNWERGFLLHDRPLRYYKNAQGIFSMGIFSITVSSSKNVVSVRRKAILNLEKFRFINVQLKLVVYDTSEISKNSTKSIAVIYTQTDHANPSIKSKVTREKSHKFGKDLGSIVKNALGLTEINYYIN